MNQRIDGNNNIQVGRVDGSLNIGSDDPLDPNNPNLIECPSCWKLASRGASPCPRCGYNIVNHFAALEREVRRKQVLGKAKVCGFVFVLATVLTNVSWLPQSLKGTFAIVAFVAAFGGAVLLSVVDKLKLRIAAVLCNAIRGAKYLAARSHATYPTRLLTFLSKSSGASIEATISLAAFISRLRSRWRMSLAL